MIRRVIHIDEDKCNGCGACVTACHEGAIGLVKSYAPYSNFCVGACLECTDGKYITGCNIENSSYGATNCAERTAFFKAVSDGITHFSRIAIAGGQRNGALQICPPCGICLQVMMEFCDPDHFEVILGDGENDITYLLRDLLPKGFGPENIK